jgi:hypothetical protein
MDKSERTNLNKILVVSTDLSLLQEKQRKHERKLLQNLLMFRFILISLSLIELYVGETIYLIQWHTIDIFYLKYVYKIEK